MGAFKGYCLGCKKRETCTKLCLEAERYVNQDNAKHRIPTVKVRDIEQMPGDGQVEVLTFKKAALGIFNKLSPRERQVVACLMEGHSSRRIAKILGISRMNVRRCIARIKAKLI